MAELVGVPDSVDFSSAQLTGLRSVRELFDLGGKVAVVTGTVGLAFHVIHRLAECGAKVVFTGRKAENGKRVETIFRDMGYEVTYFQGDISKPETCDELVAFTEKTYGPVGIVVPVAAVWQNRAFVDVQPEEFQRMLDTGLTGQYFTVQAAARSMIRAGQGGKVVTIASVAHRGEDLPDIATMTPYNALKGGVVSMTRGIAKELKQYGINVNCVAPGAMATPGAMTNTSEAVSVYGPAFVEELWRVAPSVPGSATPDDVARVILCMCTDVACFMYGQVVDVDGGCGYSFQAKPWSYTMEGGVPGPKAD